MRPGLILVASSLRLICPSRASRLSRLAADERPVPPGTGRFSVGAGFLALLTLIASPIGNSAPAPRLQLPARVVLERVTVQDILIGPAIRSAGSVSQTLVPQGPGLATTLPAPDTGGINLSIIRREPALWRIRFGRGDPRPLGFDVSYQVNSPSGIPNALGHRTNPSSTVGVQAYSTGTTIRIAGPNMFVQGDAEFVFDSTTLETPGRYTGELLITVNFL